MPDFKLCINPKIMLQWVEKLTKSFLSWRYQEFYRGAAAALRVIVQTLVSSDICSCFFDVHVFCVKGKDIIASIE